MAEDAVLIAIDRIDTAFDGVQTANAAVEFLLTVQPIAEEHRVIARGPEIRSAEVLVAVRWVRHFTLRHRDEW